MIFLEDGNPEKYKKLLKSWLTSIFVFLDWAFLGISLSVLNDFIYVGISIIDRQTQLDKIKKSSTMEGAMISWLLWADDGGNLSQMLRNAILASH